MRCIAYYETEDRNGTVFKIYSNRMEDNKSFLEMAKEIYQDDKESEILCLDTDDILIGLNMSQIEQVIEVLSLMSEYIKSE